MDYDWKVVVYIENKDGVQASIVVDNNTPKDIRFFIDNTPLAYSIPLNKQLKEKAHSI